MRPRLKMCIPDKFKIFLLLRIIQHATAQGRGPASIPPRFTQEEWVTEVDETVGNHLPDQAILTVTTVHNGDETNKFHYKVIEPSGFGADKFTMVRNNDGTGSLKIVQPLDYEDPMQRNGFRFQIQVNVGDEDNNAESSNVAYSWVTVRIRDINDNKPQFAKQNIEVSVSENAEIGKSLERFRASDPDQDGQSKVHYAIDRSSDRLQQFSINDSGIVKIQRSLDREKNPRHYVKILAIDDGTPAKTATATLKVIVRDVNDNAPRFLKNYQPVLAERQPPRTIITVLARDDDDRSRGNGAPFHFRMDSSAPDEIRASFKVEHIPKGANGDGMGLISSLRSFERDVQDEYHIPIVLKDAGIPQMTGTSTLTVFIGDRDGNKIQPAPHTTPEMPKLVVSNNEVVWQQIDNQYNIVEGSTIKLSCFGKHSNYKMVFTAPENVNETGQHEVYRYHLNNQPQKDYVIFNATGKDNGTYGCYAQKYSKKSEMVSLDIHIIKTEGTCPNFETPINTISTCQGTSVVNTNGSCAKVIYNKGSTCEAVCEDGYGFYDKPVPKYTCELDGNWAPSRWAQECYKIAPILSAQLQFKIMYDQPNMDTLRSQIIERFNQYRRVFCRFTQDCEITDISFQTTAIDAGRDQSEVRITIDPPIHNISDVSDLLKELREAILDVNEDNQFMVLTDFDTRSFLVPITNEKIKAIPKLKDHVCPSGHIYRHGFCVQCPAGVLDCQ